MEQSPPIAIINVTKTSQWVDIHRFIALLYADDPAWVEPLRQTLRSRWHPRHPWFDYGVAQAWMAVRAGEIVGLISAQFDRRNRAAPLGSVGYFGHFECVDDRSVAQALIDQAKSWLAQQGCVWMKGPFDLHINEMCGLLVDGFDEPPMMMMPHHKRYYQRLLSQCGLTKEIGLHAYRVAPNFETPKVMARLNARQGQRVTLRRINKRSYADELETLRILFNDAWQANWGFVPFSKEEFVHMGKELRAILKLDYTAIASVDGQPAGFIIALPNLNELIADFKGRLLPFNWVKLLMRLHTQRYSSARVPLMGVHSRFHNSPLGALVAYSLIDAVRGPLERDGVGQVEMSWILETNEPMINVIQSIGGEQYKTYDIMSARLQSEPNP